MDYTAIDATGPEFQTAGVNLALLEGMLEKL